MTTAIVALLAAVPADDSFAQEHKTYRCKVADVVMLSPDGRLQPDNLSRTVMRVAYDGVIIDTLTGAVTFANGQRKVWKVVQKGSGENDYVLTPSVQGTEDQVAATAATDFLRIRAWESQPTVRLLAFGLGSLASGPCEVVR